MNMNMNMNARMFKGTLKATINNTEELIDGDEILQTVKGVILSKMFMGVKCGGFFFD